MSTDISTEIVFERVDQVSDQSTGMLFTVLEGQDYQVALSTLGLSFDSTESEILNTIRPIIQEVHNIDIMRNGSWLYKMRKATDSQNIYIIPNSTAGVR